jgi:hypothetical protein
MKINNLEFQTWCKNHSETHDTKWCREVYPWIVFKEIDFEIEMINKSQRISFNFGDYDVTLLSIELQSNGRYKATFHLKSIFNEQEADWEYRKWDTIFQIVYSQEGEFITIFTKKEDPSKELVSKFMKAKFDDITKMKSRPISELLFKSLISYIVEMTYPDSLYLKKFNVNPEVEPKNKLFHIKSKYIYPLFSMGKTHWLFSSFSEEKAHRIGLWLSEQCEKITIVFCNPTYTRHHRCNNKNVEIISLFELFSKISHGIREQFEKQIIFLQNHLNLPEYIPSEVLYNEISIPKHAEYEIKKTELLEALSIMKIPITNKYEAFYFFAGMNLVNAWLSRKRKFVIDSKYERLLKDMYSFKMYVKERIIEVISSGMDGIKISIQNNLVLIELFDFHISFHSIPINDKTENTILLHFINSPENRYIEWNEKRLQPIAPLIFSLARNYKREFFKGLIM